MDCKILDIQAQDGVITAAKYICSIGQVQSEGWWFFKTAGVKPFEEITEEDVIEWVKKEAGELIETNLTRQIDALNQPKAVAPWLPQTFVPTL